jgi:hypothetical protein
MAYKNGVAIGVALNERQRELGLTREQAGQQLDTSGSLFGRWCNLKATPEDWRVDALASFLDWTTDQVVAGIYQQRLAVAGRHTGEGSLAGRLSALERRVAALEERGNL